MVKIKFECVIAGNTFVGSFITDDENGASFILSKNKEELIKDVIDRSLEVKKYSCEMC